MTYQLTIEPLGETVAVDESQTMLDACLRSGIYLPYACGHGLCGTCKVNVLDGEVDLGDASPFALLDFERAEGSALACCARLRSDATIEADVDEEPDALRYPICDLTGTVTEIARATGDIAILSIALREPGLQFQAGQYVNVTIPGCTGPRAFSIASPPSAPTRIELHVRRVPGGAGTGYIHDALAVGDTLALSGPFGRFYVRRSANAPLVFIAGGSGLSSPKSMVLDLLETGYAAPIVLFHGVRSIDDVYFHDVFTFLAAQHANFSYVPALSQHDGSHSWTGALGFVHDVAAQHFSGSFKGWNAYLCGPPPMIEASIRAHERPAVRARHLHRTFRHPARRRRGPRAQPAIQTHLTRGFGEAEYFGAYIETVKTEQSRGGLGRLCTPPATDALLECATKKALIKLL